LLFGGVKIGAGAKIFSRVQKGENASNLRKALYYGTLAA